MKKYTNLSKSVLISGICSLISLCHTSMLNAQPMRTYAYEPNKIYSINSGLGIATQIIIDPSEKVKDYGTGFSAGWDLVRRDNIFYIKPKDSDSETNMYVRTDKRSYLFDLKIVTKDWKRLEEAKLAGVTYSVNFTYPDASKDLSVTSENAQAEQNKLGLSEKEVLLTTRTGSQTYYLDYDSSADAASKWLVPVKIYDDGKLTFVQMKNSTLAPAFFGRSSDRGEEFLVNKTLQKDTYIIQGVYPFLVIRFGSNVVGIRRR
jgi:type IV secretion system protein VirB9